MGLAHQAYLVSALQCRTPQPEDLKARGWNHMKSCMLICRAVEAGCRLGASLALHMVVSSQAAGWFPGRISQGREHQAEALLLLIIWPWKSSILQHSIYWGRHRVHTPQPGSQGRGNRCESWWEVESLWKNMWNWKYCGCYFLKIQSPYVAGTLPGPRDL